MTELLAPAGNLEKLKLAFAYGADAVYLAGKKFSLRQGADNFSENEIEEAVYFAHQRRKRVYVTLNAFLHDSDFDGLGDFIDFLEKIHVDAVIVSDIGVASEIKKKTNLQIHLSTQASVLNSAHALLWKEFGVKRIVLGRESSLTDAVKIKKDTGVEIEMFIHGAMCMAYSGHCTISNYTAGRDSNRGGCIQSCRHAYEITGTTQTLSQNFMSSKDLMGLSHLEFLVKQEIDSIKIEGRMKNHFYVANTTRAYASCLWALKHEQPYEFSFWENELRKMNHRDYTSGYFVDHPQTESIYRPSTTHSDEYQFAGYILEADLENDYVIFLTRHRLTSEMHLEFLPFQDKGIEILLDEMEDLNGQRLLVSHPGSLLKLPYFEGAKENMVARTLPQAKKIITTELSPQKSEGAA